MVAVQSSSAEAASANPVSISPSAQFTENLKAFSANVGDTVRTSLEHLLEVVVTSNKLAVTKIHDSALTTVENVERFFHERSQSAYATAAAGMAMFTGLVGLGARPAQAQKIEFGNVAGTGANIDVSQFVATGTSTRISAFAGNPITGGAERGFTFAKGDQFSLLPNTTYTIALQFIGGFVNSSTGYFNFTNANIGAFNFSFGKTDVNGLLSQTEALEYRFNSSQISMRQLGPIFNTSQPFTNQTVPLSMVEFSSSITTGAEGFNGNVMGFNLSHATDAGANRPFAADGVGANGGVLTRLSNNTVGVVTYSDDAAAFRALVQGPNGDGSGVPVNTPEPGSAALILFAGGVCALSMGGGKVIWGKIQKMEKQQS